MDLMSIRRGLMSSMANGLPSFIGKMTGGYFVLDQDLNNTNYPAESIYHYAKYPITHNLGKIPDGVIVYRFTGNVTNQSTEQAVIYSAYIKNPTNNDLAWPNTSVNLYSRNGSRSSSSVQALSTTGICEIDDSIFKIRGTDTTKYKAGETYYWIAWTHND